MSTCYDICRIVALLIVAYDFDLKKKFNRLFSTLKIAAFWGKKRSTLSISCEKRRWIIVMPIGVVVTNNHWYYLPYEIRSAFYTLSQEIVFFKISTIFSLIFSRKKNSLSRPKTVEEQYRRKSAYK